MPSPLRCDCNDSWGSFGLFRVDRDYEVKGHYAQYFAAQLLTREWAQPVDRPHRLFRVASDVLDSSGNLLVTAYALERPDGQWSLLTVNKDREKAHATKIAFQDSETGKQQFFVGQVDQVSFGTSEYQWHANGVNGYAEPDGPPARSKVDGKAETVYLLPKASITVLRGRISAE